VTVPTLKSGSLDSTLAYVQDANDSDRRQVQTPQQTWVIGKWCKNDPLIVAKYNVRQFRQSARVPVSIFRRKDWEISGKFANNGHMHAC